MAWIAVTEQLTKEQKHRWDGSERKDCPPLSGWQDNVAHERSQYPKADDQLIHAAQSSPQVGWSDLHGDIANDTMHTRGKRVVLPDQRYARNHNGLHVLSAVHA